MLSIPSLRQLRIQAQQDLSTEADGALRDALINSIAYALAGMGYLDLKTLQWLSRQLFVDTADDSYALLWASIFGVDPTAAVQSTGSVMITGTEGALISGGEVLVAEDGRQYTIDDPDTIGVTGQLTVAVTAVEAGEAGDLAEGEALTFVAPPTDVDADAVVVGEDGISGGFDAETPAAVKARTLAQIRAPRRGGSEEDYEVWAKEVGGVSQAFARGSYAGIGTVLVIITKAWDPTDSEDTPVPTEALIEDVEEHLESLKPAGLHLVSVQAPTLQELDPYIVLDPDTADIRSAVQRSLALALAEVEPGGTAYYDDLVDAINRAAGEEHHRLFVSDGGGNFGPYDTVVGYNHLIVPGTITWSEPP